MVLCGSFVFLDGSFGCLVVLAVSWLFLVDITIQNQKNTKNLCVALFLDNSLWHLLNHQEPSITTKNCQEPPRTQKNHQEPQRTNNNDQEQLRGKNT